MSWQFGRIDLAATHYAIELDYEVLDPVPVNDVLRVYRDYCAHKHFRSVMPMLPGRLRSQGTEIIGYRNQDKLCAWTMKIFSAITMPGTIAIPD
jgi:hypothetical protein